MIEGREIARWRRPKPRNPVTDGLLSRDWNTPLRVEEISDEYVVTELIAGYSDPFFFYPVKLIVRRYVNGNAVSQKALPYPDDRPKAIPISSMAGASVAKLKPTS